MVCSSRPTASAARPDAASHRVASFWSCSDLLQSRFPGARFTLAGAPRTLSNAIRAFWHFGPPDNPGAVSGMDFVILDGEKASSLYAFVDDPNGGGQPPY